MLTVPSTFVSHQFSKQTLSQKSDVNTKALTPTLLGHSLSPKAMQSLQLWALNYILCTQEPPLPHLALSHLFLS